MEGEEPQIIPGVIPGRIGPRPLPVVLGLAQALWLNLPLGWAILSGASPLSKPAAELLKPLALAKRKKLLKQYEKIRAERPEFETEFPAALAAHGQEQYSRFLDGVARYRHSPIYRDIDEPPAIWREGSARLLDYGTSGGPVVFVVPSLVNRYHILDLDASHSFLRAMAASGLRPLLLDWGAPGEDEREFAIDDYMKRRLLPAFACAVEEAKGAVHVVGYCMGGLFAAALAQIVAGSVKSLMFLATPWDFHAGPENRAAAVHATVETLTPYLDAWEEMPVDVLQCFFITLQPFFLLEKFQRAAVMEEEDKWRNFVLVEDWVNDGVPLTRRVARECLALWYVENAPAEGIWTVLNRRIAPQNLSCPSLHVIPRHDKIVPPESALTLANAMQGASRMEPAFGHVSMMGHPAAPEKLWPKLFEWLASQAGSA